MKVITETGLNGTLRYDGTCRFCIGMVNRTMWLLKLAGVAAKPFEDGAGEAEMKLEWRDGSVHGGADAAFFLARRIWWMAPLGWLEWLPGVRPVARWLYHRIAAKRHCINGACEIDFGKETN